jgi:hypothetical protein
LQDLKKEIKKIDDDIVAEKDLLAILKAQQEDSDEEEAQYALK